MATLALSSAGSALGAAALPSFSAFGTSIGGAAIGQALGGIAGSYVDQALFGASGQTRVVEGPRLSDLHVLTSREGAPIPRVYGRIRLAGTVIWASDFVEEITRTRTGGNGKSAGASRASASESVTYSYFANFAIGLCEGVVTRIGQVWADGKPLDISGYTYRLYKGEEDQQPDSLIEARKGAENAPAYRGLAYIVFEHLPLESFGNRIPQLSFEVFRDIDPFGKTVRAVNIIPAAGEFVYETEAVTRVIGPGRTISENIHTRSGRTDWSTSIDQLQDEMPNVVNGAVVVAWFGSDLRAEHCLLQPGVESHDKETQPYAWQVGGLTRSTAHVVSRIDGRPAYGGTPSDQSVVAAIRDLRQRGIAPTFYPFILMDIASGNSLPDPYGAAAQPAFPWRGRITLHPAAGQPGSADQTAAAAAQIASFVGTAAVADFSLSGDEVIYSGPAEWSLRRMILHYAWLCKAAGGVDAFLLGSELRGLTWARSSSSGYPFVDALVALAADVRSILGAETKLSYAADWTEYFGHQPQDGSGDVYFHLDPLWSSPDIDAIGIDAYWPLSDWRHDPGHLDQSSGVESPYQRSYLAANIRGGEGYDWYYTDDMARTGQVRTPITDGFGEPWVFRFKDISGWWANPHHDRPGGVRAAQSTAWVPQSKPIWFTETGCPAVDNGANQPNVFVDPKSAESSLPYFSSGQRDDLIARRYISALQDFFDPECTSSPPDANPLSNVYPGRMVDPDRIYVYAWDARPYPAFPEQRGVWSDGDNWRLGHWLNGRLGAVSLDELVAKILEDYGFSTHETGQLKGVVEGYLADRPMSARQLLQPLELAYSFNSIEGAERISFRHRTGGPVVTTLVSEDLVDSGGELPLFEIRRTQETELPAVAQVGFIAAEANYAHAAARTSVRNGYSSRLAMAELPVVLGDEAAQGVAENWLRETWAGRERATFSLPPSRLGLEPGDRVRVVEDNATVEFTITEINDGLARDVTAKSEGRSGWLAAPAEVRIRTQKAPPIFGPADAIFLDLPGIPGLTSGSISQVAAFQEPWPGGVAFFSSPEFDGFALRTAARTPAVVGRLLTPLHPGPVSRWDRANPFDITLEAGHLSSLQDIDVLGGGNLAAIQKDLGLWEVIQFRNAVLVEEGRYRLSMLLRGRYGTDDATEVIAPAGAVFVLLDAGVVDAGLEVDERGQRLNWTYGPLGQAVGAPSFLTRQHAFSARSLLPFSPVHLRARRQNDDIMFSWLRRSRISGDSWERSSPPLGEDAELYELDIVESGIIRNSYQTTSPQFTYTLSDQVADFGAPPAEFDVRVYQSSALVGRGTPAKLRIQA